MRIIKLLNRNKKLAQIEEQHTKKKNTTREVSNITK